LSIFERVLSQYPDCRLISVGDGPLGEERDDVSRFYTACDVFVLNSIIEGLPMALLEAMAAGLPVVATRVGDVEFALGGTELAMLDAGDSDAMVEALCQCQEHFSESVRRGQAATCDN